MSALGMALAVAIGAGVGYGVARRSAADRVALRHAADLAAKWRQGYELGWTAGRRDLVGEQRARELHPTGHPLANVVVLEERRRRSDDFGAGA
jgi:hypothetical protein